MYIICIYYYNFKKLKQKNIDSIKNDILNFIRLLKNPNEISLILPTPKKNKKNYIMSKVFVTFLIKLNKNISEEH
jgi:hypothetical protein